MTEINSKFSAIGAGKLNLIAQKQDIKTVDLKPAETLVSNQNIFDSASLIKQRLFNSFSPAVAVNTVSNISASQNTSPVVLNSEQEAQLAYDYAPIFYLHPNEDYEPGDPVLAIEGNDPNSFSDNAEVNGQYVTVQGEPGTDASGNPVVYDSEGKVMVDENGKPVIHATQIPAESYMEIQEKAHGDADTAPILYQYNEGPPPSMTYWVFSPYNNGYNNHQGDWEGVTVEFSVNPDGTLGEPTNVIYSSHSTPVTVPWDLVPKEDGRPVVYIGEGSHAMSPNTDNRPTEVSGFNDHFGKGERIDSRETSDGKPRLRSVEEEPWYGMQAHWGQKGDSMIDHIPNWIPRAKDLEGMNDGVTGPSPNGKKRIDDERSEVEKEADELILKHAKRDENGDVVFDEDGQPVINYKSLAAEAADLARSDPERSADLITAIGNRVQSLNGEGDEFAQEFIDQLCPDGTNVENSELAEYADTEAGREVLMDIERLLLSGKVHSDEWDDINKIERLIYFR